SGTPWTVLAKQIENAGGTADILVRWASVPVPVGYSLLGWQGAGPAAGLEATPLLDRSQSAGRLTGILTRDGSSLLTPDVSNPAGQVNSDLLDVVYQDPTPWPGTGDRGFQGAL